MQKVYTVIGFVSLYLVVFQMLTFVPGARSFIIGMFILSPFLVLYMVYTVLKDGTTSKHNFEDRFYDDWDYERNNTGGDA